MVAGVDLANKIFKFDFEVVTEPTNDDAVWRKALQRKRYFYPAPRSTCQKR
jgi:hypothetical protein